MDINLIPALIYSILPTALGTLITLYFTEQVKGKVKNNFDQKLEKIKKEHSIEITKFQAEINLLKSQENYKFTKLHEKRFEILEVIYKKLNHALHHLGLYVSPFKLKPQGISYEENEDKLQESYMNTHNKFAQFFLDNKIYLNERINELIENYLKEVGDIYHDYSFNHQLRKMGSMPDAETSKKAFSAYKKIPEKITPIISEIEQNFREILDIK